jgi:hypothetical protein
MGNEDTSQNSARVIDLSAARAAKEQTMDTLTAPGPMHPAARALAKRESDAGQSTGQD